MSEHPFIEVILKLQYDLTSIQARLTDLKRNLVSELPAEPSAHRCVEDGCGLVFRGPKRLAEHSYVSHGGPEPEHWVTAEALTTDADAAAKALADFPPVPPIGNHMNDEREVA